MVQFEQAITRTPSDTFAEGLTHGLLGKPDVALAKEQHKAYIKALEFCGLKVTVLDMDSEHPDSCFVEDPAIVNEEVAIITSPCEASRRGEEQRIVDALKPIYGNHIAYLHLPGTLEGGDICKIGKHYLIGNSRRTNDAGAQQLADILAKYGYTSDFVNFRDVKTVLHLKTGMSYLGDNTIIVRPEIASHPALASYRRIVVDEDETYAANCIRVNDYVIIPKGFDKTIAKVESAGFKTLPVAVSEFEKQDGGLSCLSLRIPKLNI